MSGAFPDAIAQAYPLLTLEQVYGAIAFYLANREAINAYLEAGEAEVERLRQASQIANPALHQKLAQVQDENSLLGYYES